jgi:glycosyltransferase involved in cell wall biosynthesis
MKVAYLVNQYPKTSHTFIRREILALEEQGHEVERVSVRRTDDPIVDESDQREVARTRVILDVGPAGLLQALARTALAMPSRFAEALAITLRIGWVSERGLLRNFAYLAEACVLERWLRDAGTQHVHAHFGTNSTAVALLCHVLGGPGYSFTTHGPEEFDKPLMIALREKLERARFAVAISSFCRSQLFRHCSYGHWPKIHIVRCGLDRDFLEAQPVPMPARPRIVNVGRLHEQKGQMLLVEAFARVVEKHPDAELVLVGDGELRREIEQAIDRLGIRKNVRITGWASNTRVREELESGRCLVLPSFAEGLPVVIMEALALARPVLSTYVAGIPELVDGGAGWLVPAGSVDALAEAIDEVLAADVSALDARGKEGQARVRDRHDARKEAQRLAELFERYAGT